MGLFDFFKKKEAPVQSIPVDAAPMTVYQPLTGEVITLEAVGDGVFSAGILGGGCGVKPTDNKVFAPVNGTISTVAETKHAVGVTSADGMELLIHVGIDTVDMNGKGFDVKVKEGDKVTAGQLLMTFSKQDIAAAGHPDTTVVLVTNTDEYKAVTLTRTGAGEAGQKLLTVES